MTGTPEVLAETTMFGTDAFSQVLDIVHVRGETARVVTPDHPRDYDVPPGNPCVYIVEQGALEIAVRDLPPVTLREKQIALMLRGTARRAVFSDPRRNTPRPGRLTLKPGNGRARRSVVFAAASPWMATLPRGSCN
ncbi:MAG: cupin domain-containing protein, partial [Pseudomonadota bacterium]